VLVARYACMRRTKEQLGTPPLLKK